MQMTAEACTAAVVAAGSGTDSTFAAPLAASDTWDVHERRSAANESTQASSIAVSDSSTMDTAGD